ncbi:MAG: NAD(P)-binding domain-containing protein, partial [Chloroflexota bacterium]
MIMTGQRTLSTPLGRKERETMKVGLIGVGTMGSRMATAQVAAGHTVLARDIDPAAAKR